MLSDLVHFELLALAVIVLFLIFILLFVKGSIGFVGHRKEGLRGGGVIRIEVLPLKTTPQGSKIRELVAV